MHGQITFYKSRFTRIQEAAHEELPDARVIRHPSPRLKFVHRGRKVPGKLNVDAVGKKRMVFQHRTILPDFFFIQFLTDYNAVRVSYGHAIDFKFLSPAMIFWPMNSGSSESTGISREAKMAFPISTLISEAFPSLSSTISA